MNGEPAVQTSHHEPIRRPTKRRATRQQRRHSDRAQLKKELRNLIHDTRR